MSARLFCAVAVAAAALGFSGIPVRADELASPPSPRHKLPPSADGNLVVGLCDGETSVEVPGVRADETLTQEQGRQVAEALMREWRRKHAGAESGGDAWRREEIAVAQAQTGPGGAGGGKPDTSEHGTGTPSRPATPPQGGQPAAAPTAGPTAEKAAPEAAAAGAQRAVQAQTYGAFSERDQQIWAASTDRLIAEGKRIFHDAQALGGTTAISCDMCHPDASNTHPETYPKFQVQLGRVALLRDMINWCIENPVRGKPLADDDPRLKALEAYILAQRRGVALEYGKH
jgi:hypothetical protein